MNALQFTILYVTNPASSAKFYQRILNVSPVELSPTFAMLALPSACRLGLWARSGGRTGGSRGQQPGRDRAGRSKP